MLFGILFTGALTIAFFVLVVTFFWFLDSKLKEAKLAAILGITLIGIAYGLYNLSFNFGTTWVNAGYQTFVVDKIDIDNYSVEYKGKPYKIDNLIDESDNSKKIEYSVTVESKNATPGLFSVYVFPDMRVREDVTVYVQPKTENKDNLDN